jgi:hypothetical protein
MRHQPDKEPKGNPPKEIVYICDRKKECNKHGACVQCCKHTTDIRHAVNFIDSGDGIHFEERPERKTGKWIKADSQQYFRKHYPYFTCSECGYRKDSQKKWIYCPNCGALMENAEG